MFFTLKEKIPFGAIQRDFLYPTNSKIILKYDSSKNLTKKFILLRYHHSEYHYVKLKKITTMEGIIKLRGKIVGINKDAYATIKLNYTEAAQKKPQDAEYSPTEKYDKGKRVFFAYNGPAHLSKNLHEKFAFSDNVKFHCNGIGSEINDLFIGDEVEVYARWHTTVSANDTEHLILDNVIVCSLDETPHLVELIKG